MERGRYIALSHCWGKLGPSEKGKFCTYICNINKRRESIDWGNLPKTFQDAVTVTRELGVRFLWIDSVCIIQPHNGCSNKCGKLKDWDRESKRMESYYSSAYCTIAATSARDSTEGFLGPRPARRCVWFPGTLNNPLYVCETIDDFRSDVEEGALSQRGWTLQERALSRRTIHFTANQTYWECGDGIKCETLTTISNPKASFMADSRFPKSALDYSPGSRFLLFQYIFEMYSKRAFTEEADRSIAISGLEERLARTFNSDGKYGAFGCYLHRSLLWQRSGDARMKRINYPTNRKVPSWSWMASKGDISYMDISLGSVEWSHAVRYHSTSKLHNGLDYLRRRGIAFSVELKALAREFLLKEDERRLLIFDDDNGLDIQRLRCVVIGRKQLRYSGEQEHYVLVIKPVSGEKHTYERVGVGSIRMRHILFEGSGVEVLIV